MFENIGSCEVGNRSWQSTSGNKDHKIWGSSALGLSCVKVYTYCTTQHLQTQHTMSTSRLATSILFRASRSSITKSSRQFRPLSRPALRVQPAITKTIPQRFYSQSERPSKIYTFEEVPLPPPPPSQQSILTVSRSKP